jgi:hypothetical protein
MVLAAKLYALRHPAHAEPLPRVITNIKKQIAKAKIAVGPAAKNEYILLENPAEDPRPAARRR